MGVRQCRNGHPFEPGVDIDNPSEVDHTWCNICGEVQRTLSVSQEVFVDHVEADDWVMDGSQRKPRSFMLRASSHGGALGIELRIGDDQLVHAGARLTVTIEGLP